MLVATLLSDAEHGQPTRFDNKAATAFACALPVCDLTSLLRLLFVMLQMGPIFPALSKQHAPCPAHSSSSGLPAVAPAAPDSSRTIPAQPQGPPSATHQPGLEVTSPFQDSFEAVPASSGPVQPSDPQASAWCATPPTPDTPPAGAVCEGWVAFGLWEHVTSRDCSPSLAESGADSEVPITAAMPLDIIPGPDESLAADWATSWDDPTPTPSDALYTRAEPDDMDDASVKHSHPASPAASASAQPAESHGSDDVDRASIRDTTAPLLAPAHYSSRKPKGLCIDLTAPLAPPSPHARLRNGVIYNRFKMAFCEQRMMLEGRADSFTAPPAPYSFLMGAQNSLEPAPACQGRQNRRGRVVCLAKACLKRICVPARKAVPSAPEETDHLLWSYEDLCPGSE